MYAAVTIIVYIVSFFGLMDIWGKALHFIQDSGTAEPPVFVKMLVTGAIVPFVLGFICGLILRPKELIQYWPIVVSPFLTLGLRLLLDDVSPDWLSQNILLLMLGVVLTVLIAVLGAWSYSKLTGFRA